MAPVAKATEAFETIVNARKDPALLTWSGAGVYHLRVFPLEPGKQHRIVVAYEVDLSLVGDDAELRLGLPQDVPDVRVAVTGEGVGFSRAPDAIGPDGAATWHEPHGPDLRLSVRAPGDRWLVGADAGGRMHTAAWVRPDVPRVERASPSHRARFLLDVSKSVSSAQMHAWRELLLAVLESNRERITEFSVGFFAMRTRWWRTGFVSNTPERVAALRRDLATLEPGGATDLAQALRSFDATDEATDVFLLTDAMRTWGAKDHEEILAALPPKCPVFAYTVGVGAEDESLLAAIADRSGGGLISVRGRADIPAAATAHCYEGWVLDAASVPGLDDLLVRGHVRRIHPGQRVRLAGRGQPEAGAALHLHLRRGADKRIARIAIPKPRTSSMAARAYGLEGVERLELAGPEVSKIATDYAMHYRVVRRSCALVMLEREAQYARFGLNTTGHDGRVAASPVLIALAKASATNAARRPSFSLAAYARNRGVSAALIRGLAPTRRTVAWATPPEDATLVALGGALEGRTASAQERLLLGLHAYGLGLPDHAIDALMSTDTASRVVAARPHADWLLARAAQAALRPQLALVAYEAALGRSGVAAHGETLWVIAADYERFLKRLNKDEVPARVLAFAQARLRSLAKWRDLMGGYAPPAAAELVVLHLPMDKRDLTRAAFSGPGARIIPDRDLGAGPQLMAIAELPREAWSVRLVRSLEPSKAPKPWEPPATEVRLRSLVVVIRDWGLESERMVLVRSVGPNDDLEILSADS